MPTLPFIDLLILAGWSSLFGGLVLKLITMTTTYRPTLFGIGPLDFLILAGVFLLLALTLSARTWVKAHEAEKATARRRLNEEMERRVALLDGGGLHREERGEIGEPVREPSRASDRSAQTG